MQFFLPMIAVLPGVLTGILSVVAATAISFAVILLVASFYRFQHIVKMAEDTDPDALTQDLKDDETKLDENKD